MKFNTETFTKYTDLTTVGAIGVILMGFVEILHTFIQSQEDVGTVHSMATFFLGGTIVCFGLVLIGFHNALCKLIETIENNSKKAQEIADHLTEKKDGK